MAHIILPGIRNTYSSMSFLSYDIVYSGAAVIEPFPNKFLLFLVYKKNIYLGLLIRGILDLDFADKIIHIPRVVQCVCFDLHSFLLGISLAVNAELKREKERKRLPD